MLYHTTKFFAVGLFLLVLGVSAIIHQQLVAMLWGHVRFVYKVHPTLNFSFDKAVYFKGECTYWQHQFLLPNIQFRSPCIMCVQYIGGYHEYTGGCSVHRGDIMMHVGRYHEHIGDVQYIGVFNINQRLL